MSLCQENNFTMVQIEKRFSTVPFEGPVYCHVKMATEKSKQKRQKEKVCCCECHLFITRALLLNIVLRVSLTFVTQIAVNSFGLGGKSS